MKSVRKFLNSPRGRKFSHALMLLCVATLGTYEIFGKDAHEYLGVAALALVIFHLRQNRAWLWDFARKFRTDTLKTALNFALIIAIFTAFASGIVMSRFVVILTELPKGTLSIARDIHMCAVHWAIALCGVHFGLHLRAWCAKFGAKSRAIFYAALAIFASGGIYAIARFGLYRYLFLSSHFAFFDRQVPLPLYIALYLGILALFSLAGFVLAALAKRLKKQISPKETA